MKDEEDEEIEEIEEIGKVTSEDVNTYLREKFGGALPDTEIDSYLEDRFRQYDLPGGQKRKQTAAEMIREAEKRARGL